MRKILLTIGGVCAAAAGFLLWQRRTQAAGVLAPQPVDEFAHQLQDAWQDHHTRA